MRTKSFFFSFYLFVLLLFSNSLVADFLIDIHLNGSEYPSLSFGEQSSDIELGDLLPAPPFSGMFGVVDVHFENNHEDDTIKDAKWYERLSTDLKKSGEPNKWILNTKGNARLQWKKKSGTLPANLEIAWIDQKNELKTLQIKDTETLSLKAGTVYTIQENINLNDLEESGDKSTQYAGKKDGKMEAAVFEFDTPQLVPAEIRFSFNAGMDMLRYFGETGKEDAAWEVKFNAPGYNPSYRWEELELIVTLNPGNSTRNEEEWTLELTPQKTSATPVQVSEVTEENNDPVFIADSIIAIVLKFGTLDFDGDGEVTMDDVLYLYNFYANGSPQESDDEDEEMYNIESLLDSTTKNKNNNEDLQAAKNAIEIFRADPDSLKFDESTTELHMDDILFFYNFFANGSPQESDDEDEEIYNIESLLDSTTKNKYNEEDMQTAKKALDTLREYFENL